METKKENHKPEPVKAPAPKPEPVVHAAVAPAPLPVAPKIDSSAEALDAKREEIAKSEANTKRLHAELDAMIGARRHAK